MATTYEPGERLLIQRRSPYAAGDVIVFRAPPAHSFDTDILVKRVAAVVGEPVPDDFPGIGAATVPPGQLLVRADSPRGLDSRQMGLIEACRVVGVVREQRPPPAAAAQHANGRGRARVVDGHAVDDCGPAAD